MVVVSRFGAASAPWVAQYLADVHEVLPFTVMGGFAVIAAVVMFKLKETKGIPTAETIGGNESGKKLQIFSILLKRHTDRECFSQDGTVLFKLRYKGCG